MNSKVIDAVLPYKIHMEELVKQISGVHHPDDVKEYLEKARDFVRPRIKNNGEYPDAGIDLFSCQFAEVAPGSMTVISSGLSFKFHPFTFGLIFPRGGDSFLTGSGVIDSGYRGIVKVRVYNPESEPMLFTPGSSIGQMVLIHNAPLRIDLRETEDTDEATERGDTGRINLV